MKSTNLIFAAVLFCFVSCTKEGPAGPIGATGQQGSAGQAGNANVVDTTFLVTNSSQWAPEGSPAVRWNCTIVIPALTQSVFDNGIVQVFWDYLPTPSLWVAMPTTVLYTPTGTYNFGFYTTRDQKLVLQWAQQVAGLTAVNPIANFGGAIRFKVIIIPKK